MCDLQDLINIKMKSKNFPHVSDSKGKSNADSNAGYLKFQKWHQLKRL